MNLLEPPVAHNALFFNNREDGREIQLLEFEMELLCISLYFWQPNAITLKSLNRDAYCLSGTYQQLGHQQTD